MANNSNSNSNNLESNQVKNTNVNNSNNNDTFFTKILNSSDINIGNSPELQDDPELYYKNLCEYLRSDFSITYNIIIAIIGLILAYRTYNRISRGWPTYVFLVLYGIIIVLKVIQITLNLAFSEEESAKKCQAYHMWFNKNKVARIFVSILRFVMFWVVFFYGFISLFLDTDYFKNKTKNVSLYQSLHNNRNYRKNNNKNNNKNVRKRKNNN